MIRTLASVLLLALISGNAMAAEKITGHATVTSAVAFTGNFSFTVAAPVTFAVNFSPSTVTVPNNAPVGTLLTNVTVTVSDGSPFTGTLSISDSSGIVVASGMKLQTARLLTTADGGTHNIIVTATQ